MTYFAVLLKAKSRKYRVIFEVNSPETLRQVRDEDWSQQVEHMKVSNGTGPGVQRRPLSAYYTRRKCSIETSHKSVKRSSLVKSSRISIKDTHKITKKKQFYSSLDMSDGSSRIRLSPAGRGDIIRPVTYLVYRIENSAWNIIFSNFKISSCILLK